MSFKRDALELHLRQVSAELRRLEGFSLTSIFSSLTGQKQARLDEARQHVQELQIQYDAASKEVDSIERQVDELSARVSSTAEAQTAYQEMMAALESNAEAQGGETASRIGELREQIAQAEAWVQSIQKAMQSGDEARRDLLGEVETLSTLGRCRVSEGHRLISMAVNAALKPTLAQCAGRVRQAVRRFAGRYMEAVSHSGATVDAEAADIRQSLDRIGQQFSVDWFYSDGVEFNSSGYVEAMLRTANVKLELILSTARGLVEDLTRRRGALVEALPTDAANPSPSRDAPLSPEFLN